MTPGEALAAIRGYASVWRFVLTRHARKRMDERNSTQYELHFALTNAKGCSQEDNEKWRVVGPALVGDDLQIIIAFEDGLIVITFF